MKNLMNKNMNQIIYISGIIFLLALSATIIILIASGNGAYSTDFVIR